MYSNSALHRDSIRYRTDFRNSIKAQQPALWFGSPWTQRVRATAAARRPDGSRAVWLQAVQEDADELPWLVRDDGSADGPLPEYAGGPANLPLRLRLGQLARLVLAGEIAVERWAAVTGLVAAAELPALLAGERRDELLRALGLT
jgi:hypothetical protein